MLVSPSFPDQAAPHWSQHTLLFVLILRETSSHCEDRTSHAIVSKACKSDTLRTCKCDFRKGFSSVHHCQTPLLRGNQPSQHLASRTPRHAVSTDLSGNFESFFLLPSSLTETGVRCTVSSEACSKGHSATHLLSRLGWTVSAAQPPEQHPHTCQSHCLLSTGRGQISSCHGNWYKSQSKSITSMATELEPSSSTTVTAPLNNCNKDMTMSCNPQ